LEGLLLALFLFVLVKCENKQLVKQFIREVYSLLTTREKIMNFVYLFLAVVGLICMFLTVQLSSNASVSRTSLTTRPTTTTTTTTSTNLESPIATQSLLEVQLQQLLSRKIELDKQNKRAIEEMKIFKAQQAVQPFLGMSVALNLNEISLEHLEKFVVFVV
jgi:hypothetical protein